MSAPKLDVDEAAVQNKKAEKAIWPWHRFLPAEQTWRRKRRRRGRESERLAHAHFFAMKEHLVVVFFFVFFVTWGNDVKRWGTRGRQIQLPPICKDSFSAI